MSGIPKVRAIKIKLAANSVAAAASQGQPASSHPSTLTHGCPAADSISAQSGPKCALTMNWTGRSIYRKRERERGGGGGGG